MSHGLNKDEIKVRKKYVGLVALKNPLSTEAAVCRCSSK